MAWGRATRRAICQVLAPRVWALTICSSGMAATWPARSRTMNGVTPTHDQHDLGGLAEAEGDEQDRQDGDRRDHGDGRRPAVRAPRAPAAARRSQAQDQGRSPWRSPGPAPSRRRLAAVSCQSGIAPVWGSTWKAMIRICVDHGADGGQDLVAGVGSVPGGRGGEIDERHHDQRQGAQQEAHARRRPDVQQAAHRAPAWGGCRSSSRRPLELAVRRQGHVGRVEPQLHIGRASPGSCRPGS